MLLLMFGLYMNGFLSFLVGDLGQLDEWVSFVRMDSWYSTDLPHFFPSIINRGKFE